MSSEAQAEQPTSTEAAGHEDVEGQWSAALSELEDIDRLTRDLQAQLRELESRRQDVAAKEKVLRRAAHLKSRAQNGKAQPSPTSAKEAITFEVLTPRSLEESPRKPGAPPVGVKASLKLHHAMGTSGPWPPQTPRGVEDWEVGLDSIGVARCGVCGMRFPMDTNAIEKHSLECKGQGAKEDRRPSRQDVLPPSESKQPTADLKAPGQAAFIDRAAALRSKLAAKSQRVPQRSM